MAAAHCTHQRPRLRAVVRDAAHLQVLAPGRGARRVRQQAARTADVQDRRARHVAAQWPALAYVARGAIEAALVRRVSLACRGVVSER